MAQVVYSIKDVKEGPFVARDKMGYFIRVVQDKKLDGLDVSIIRAIEIEFPDYFSPGRSREARNHLTLKIIDWLNELVKEGMIIEMEKPYGKVWVCPATDE